MNKFLLYLKHEFKSNKVAFLLPLIIQGFNYVTSFIFLILLWSKIVKTDVEIAEGIQALFVEQGIAIDSDGSRLVLMVVGYFMTVFTLGIFGVFVGMIRASTTLNYEKRMGYELFYRTQPVSIWARTGSKYINSILGAFVSAMIVAFVNYIAMSVIFSTQFVNNGLVWNSLFRGFTAGCITAIGPALLFGSLGFLTSAVFTRMALMKGAFVLLALGFIEVMTKLAGIKFLSIFSYLMKMAQELLQPSSIVPKAIENISSIQEIPIKSFFYTEQIWIILFSAVVFVGATYIFKYKKIES